jgi:LuxR family maltose regulon positive regulatory protein
VSVAPLLATKFFVPRWRRGLVSRPRLTARLNGAAESKLTLVSAPAGFGKTTLLAEWLADASNVTAAWLSLDQADSDPVSFWRYASTALQNVAPGVGAAALALLQSSQPPVETVLATLLNELSELPTDIVLVLDDYHIVDARDIQAGMVFLLDHLPAHLHLVIATRADPVLPLARLRARGELVEIRAVDLRFTLDEAAAYVNDVMGLHLTATDLTTLEDRTEGWIAALQLAALSMQGRVDVADFIAGFAGHDRFIVDYLVEEVLQRQPELVREFLLQTSILHQLSGSVCDAVTGQDNGKAMLDGLERSNLFLVPLDDRRQRYRYHKLFADVLHAHLVDEYPNDVAELHRRASNWCEHHDDPSEAIRHAFAARDLERAARLIELAARAILQSYRPATLVELVAALPSAMVQSRPVLSTYYAFALYGVGELDKGKVRLSDAERALAMPERIIVDEAESRSLPGIIALARAFDAQARGDVATTVERARQALDLMPESDHVWRAGAAILLALAQWTTGNVAAAQRVHDDGVSSLARTGDISLAISAAYDGADLRKVRGRLAEARAVYERWLRVANDNGHGADAVPGVADLHFGLSDLYCEWNDVETATWHLRRGEDLAKRAALPQTPARACVARARVLQLTGDLDGALQQLEHAERLFMRDPVPAIRPIGALKARLWLAQGRLAEALDWTRAHGLSADDQLAYPREFEHITLARVLIARGGTTALQLLGRLLDEADAHGRTGSVIEILTFQALAHRTRGGSASALAALERALGLSEPEGYVRVFVDEGEPMRELLRQAMAAGIASAYVRRLLGALHQGQPQPTTAAVDLVEPLTARELEVLRLVAVGMRNQEIADQLVISLPTVKRHIANSYGKLGARHRTEAVARATELGLL